MMKQLLMICMTLLMVLGFPLGTCAYAADGVTEIALNWPNKSQIPEQLHGSTHELTFKHDGGNYIWVTGQNYDELAKVDLDGHVQYFEMPSGSRPHGIEFDAEDRLWVSLEFDGLVAHVDDDGTIIDMVDVRLYAEGAKEPINTHPHGLGLGADGQTLWFTGKKTNTVGKISFSDDGSPTVEHFELPTVGAVPIYLATGPDGNIWCTELVGNQIARITPDGKVTEFSIPTHNSRPIAIVQAPQGMGDFMWFSEEAGNKVGRIDMDGHITEFPVPFPEKNIILAGMAFDDEGNLWTQSYVDKYDPLPEGADYIVKVDKAIHTAPQSESEGSLAEIPITYYPVPSRHTIMHRIIQGPDRNMWFTELGTDQLGQLVLHK